MKREHLLAIPIDWENEPHASVSYEVMMEASELHLISGVEYNFQCVSGFGNDSGWQNSPIYIDTNLQSETEYSYTVQARSISNPGHVSPPSLPYKVQTQAANSVDEIMEQLELIPLVYNGNKNNRINIVVMNRWVENDAEPYNRPEMKDEFIADVENSVVKALTFGDPDAVTPYANYSAFYNIYALWWPNIPVWDPKRPECLGWKQVQEIRNRLFLPWRDEYTGWVTLLSMLNTTGGGGGAGRELLSRVGDAYIVGNEIASMMHEFAHTATGIADEYTSSGKWGHGSETYNTTNFYQRNQVKWRAWITPETPVPTPYTDEYLGVVGLFEGGQHRLSDHFRPTARGCLMGAGAFGVQHLCPICVQRTILKHYDLVNPIERITPTQTEMQIEGETSIHFQVIHLKPEPNTQKTEWRLNGKVIAVNVNQVEITLGSTDHYQLTFSLADKTKWIRPDPPYAAYPLHQVSWIIKNSNPTHDSLPLEIELEATNPSFLGHDGQIQSQVSGGTPPYEYIWSNGSQDPFLSDLSAGTYELRVIDQHFDYATTSYQLEQKSKLDIDLRSVWTKNGWKVDLNLESDEKLNCWWSTGAMTSTVDGLKDGIYQYKVSNTDGVELESEIRLLKPEVSLQAVSEIIPATAGQMDGAVWLNIHGGRKPYSVTWADPRLFSDEIVLYQAEEAQYLGPISGRDEGCYGKEMGCLKFEGQAGWIDWQITVPLTGRYPLTFRYKTEDRVTALLLINGNDIGKHLVFPKSGDWQDYQQEVNLQGGKNSIRLQAENQSMLSLDYLSVPQKAWFEKPDEWVRTSLSLGTYTVLIKDANHTAIEKTVQIPEANRFLLENVNLEKADTDKIRIADPDPDYYYYWYDADFSIHHTGQTIRPIAQGTGFEPERSGNYYLSCQRISDGAISQNRVGVAVTKGDRLPLCSNHVSKTELEPDQLSANLLLWLDASQAESVEDIPLKRGALIGWKGKNHTVGFDPNGFVYYQPNVQNGKAIASWETIWLQGLEKPISGFQTVVMVYREHPLSSPGSSPWFGLSPFIGCGTNQLFLPDAPNEILKGAVYINGVKIDPLQTPQPENFCVATFEFTQVIENEIKYTDTGWEGAIGEMLIYDGLLTGQERQQLEADLYRKWISAIHLE